MSDEISARNVSKFNGTNFQSWKFQVNALFVAHGIRDIVDGWRVKPEGVGRDIARWIKYNAKAMFLIESVQLEPLLVCVTAKEMWEKLTSVHEQKSASNKLLLTTKLYEYRMSPGDTIIQHVAKVQNMAAQLQGPNSPPLGRTNPGALIWFRTTPGAPIRFRTFLEPPLGPKHWSFEPDRIDTEEATTTEAKDTSRYYQERRHVRNFGDEFDAVQLQIEIQDEAALQGTERADFGNAYYNIELTILEKIETATVNEAATIANATGFTPSVSSHGSGIKPCLNSRPLCPLTEDPSDLNVSTPGHFLIGTAITSPLEHQIIDVRQNCLRQHVEQMRQHFWNRGCKEYVGQLQERPKSLDPRSPGNSCRVIAVHPGPDNIIRVATLKTDSGTQAPLNERSEISAYFPSTILCSEVAEHTETDCPTNPGAPIWFRTTPGAPISFRTFLEPPLGPKQISTTVLKMLRSAKLHPYKMQMVQELAEDDPDRRIQFCEQRMNLMNCYCYWADHNPH
ncbi:hypothetical protein GEV33_014398 [Tenebrio molitor]|uniref:Retrotransposon Copia-like N-terminal domain-containing protein n=1 Tax=Tenebrio molitor TaxID=7067 RepID=A0A8J6H5P5_TENMO|nr:hypothetical protein GEV33_014398 [Tenebrio molitor]